MQKLPVFKIFGDMLDSVIENLSAALRMSWPWLLVLFPIRLAGDLYLFFEGISKSKPMPTQIWTIMGVTYTVALLTAIAFASIAVNWHRFILRSELAEGGQRLRLDGLVWRYFFVGLGIAVMVGLILTAFVFGAGLLGAVFAMASTALAVVVGTIVGLPLLLLVFGISARWSVKLVAIALGNKEYSLSDAWRITTGNTWRLAGLEFLFIFAILLIGLINFGASYVAGIAESALVAAAVAAVSVIVGWFSTLMGITMLTSVYAFFVEKRVF